MAWTLQAGAVEKTLSEWRIPGLEIRRTSGAADEISFQQHIDFDVDIAFGHGVKVVLRQDTVIRFTGTIVTPTRTGRSGVLKNRANALSYVARGPWSDLERIIFEQQWKKQDGEQSASVVILGRDINNARLTAGEVLAEILDYAITGGADLSYNAADFAGFGVQFPETTETDITCSEAIGNALRWYKDAVIWFDYTSAVPVIRFTRRASATAETVSLTSAGLVGDFNIYERPDLLVPGVVIRYTRTNAINGQTWTDITTDSAGATSGKNVIKMTVRLTGLNLTTESCEISHVAAPAAHSEIQAWLIERNPWLGSDNVSGIEWSGQSCDSLHDWVLSDGHIPDWVGAETERAVISAAARITYADGTVENVVVSDEQTFLSTSQTVFSRIISGTPEEEAPSGIAAAIYSQLNTLQYEGRFTLKQPEVTGLLHPGKVVNFSGGRTAWGTINAQIQSVSERPSGGAGVAETDVTFGPAEHLTAQDFVEMSRANRQRNLTLLSFERSSASPASDIKMNGPAATTNSASGRESFEALAITSGSKSILLNPAAADFIADRFLKINSAGTGVEWVDEPAGRVTESATTPFQAAKLVLASPTAHELLGTLIGINLAGAAYQGYGDSDISTDARVAQIADSRFSANWPSGVIFGSGVSGQIAIFDGFSDVLGSSSLHSLLATYLGTPPPTGTARIVYYDTDGDLKFTDLHNIEPAAVLCTGDAPADNSVAYFSGGKYIFGLANPAADSVLANDAGTLGLRWKALTEVGGLPSGTVGQVVYHNGTSWVVLAKPAADKFLKNTAAGAVAWADSLPSGSAGQILYHNGSGWVRLNAPASEMFLKNTAAGAVSWSATPAATVQSSGGTGASLVTSDGKIKTIYGV